MEDSINEDDYIIPSNYIQNERFSDPFYYDDFQEYFNIKYNSFLDLQSLFPEYLIQKENGNKNKKIILNLGKSAYPPYLINNENSGFGAVTAFTIAICLCFFI